MGLENIVAIVEMVWGPDSRSDEDPRVSGCTTCGRVRPRDWLVPTSPCQPILEQTKSIGMLTPSIMKKKTPMDQWKINHHGLRII